MAPYVYSFPWKKLKQLKDDGLIFKKLVRWSYHWFSGPLLIFLPGKCHYLHVNNFQDILGGSARCYGVRCMSPRAMPAPDVGAPSASVAKELVSSWHKRSTFSIKINTPWSALAKGLFLQQELLRDVLENHPPGGMQPSPSQCFCGYHLNPRQEEIRSPK